MHADGCSIGISALSERNCNPQDQTATGDVMDMSAAEQPSALKSKAYPSILKGLFAFLARRIAPAAKLDLDGMPDRVKRDLGFLDGREPRYEDERAR
jgi:hypothetical protein